MKRKSICLVLVIVFIFAMSFSACNNNTNQNNNLQNNENDDNQTNNEVDNQENNQNNEEEIRTVKFVGPGEAPIEEDDVLLELNNRLMNDGMNIEFVTEWIGWDVWDQKVNLKLSTGEIFDLLHVFSDAAKINYISMDAVIGLNEYIDEYGENLMKVLPERTWIPETFDETIYAIPTYWCDNTNMGGRLGYLSVREDKVNEADLDLPNDEEELFDFMVDLQASWGGDQTVYAWEHNLRRTLTWLHRTYDSWPFYTENENPVIYISEEGEVKSWYETEEFKKDCEYYERLYNANLIHPDVLSVPNDTRNNVAQQGEILVGLGTFGAGDVPGLRKTVDPNISIEEFLLNDEEPPCVFSPTLNRNMVPASSEHPEAAVQFIDWLYSSDENHDLLIYGIEGKHYESKENDRIERVYNDNNQMLYNFPAWQMAYYAMTNYSPDDLDEYVERVTTVNEESIYHISSGFIFDSSKVKSEYANVMAEIPTSINPIKFGVVSYEENFDDALVALKAAGLDEVVEEYKRQFNEWLENQ